MGARAALRGDAGEGRAMLVLGMLFGVLVAGPLLVLGALALANNERAMAWLGGLWRRGRPPVVHSAPDEAQRESDEAEAPVDVSAAAEGASAP